MKKFLQEFLKKIEEMFTRCDVYMMLLGCSNIQLHNIMLPVSKGVHHIVVQFVKSIAMWAVLRIDIHYI